MLLKIKPPEFGCENGNLPAIGITMNVLYVPTFGRNLQVTRWPLKNYHVTWGARFILTSGTSKPDQYVKGWDGARTYDEGMGRSQRKLVLCARTMVPHRPAPRNIPARIYFAVPGTGNIMSVYHTGGGNVMENILDVWKCFAVIRVIQGR